MQQTSQEKTNSERDWCDELINPVRIPRPGWESLEELLAKSRNAKVLLKEKSRYTDVIVRFPVSSSRLPKDVQRMYAHLGMKIDSVFSEVVWKSPPKGSSTLWYELVRTAHKAYREMWFHWQALLYLGHTPPKIDAMYKELLQGLRTRTATPVGRREIHDGLNRSLLRRFKELHEKAVEIHSLVERYAKEKLPIAQVRKSVFRKVYCSRIEDYVLRSRDSAFDAIPYRKRNIPVRLEDPSSWNPRQLAISLLALEREQHYQTVEKRLSLASKRPK